MSLRNSSTRMQAEEPDQEAAGGAGGAPSEPMPDHLARAVELSATPEGASSQLLALRDEWLALSAELAAQQPEHDARRDQVAELQQELAFMNRELEARQLELEQRGNSMSDASAVARLRTAIAVLQGELHDMDVRIGLTASLLMDCHAAAQ
eukprot:scaffold6.g2567.t1